MRAAAAVMVEKMTNESEETGKRAGRRFTTLVVDDEHDLANVTAELLTYHGIDVLVAYSADEALQVMKTRADIDAVFSDVMMPSITGLELAEIITRTYPAVKIVLTSGFYRAHLLEANDAPLSVCEKAIFNRYGHSAVTVLAEDFVVSFKRKRFLSGVVFFRFSGKKYNAAQEPLTTVRRSPHHAVRPSAVHITRGTDRRHQNGIRSGQGQLGRESRRSRPISLHDTKKCRSPDCSK